MTITEQTTVADIASAVPSSVRVFQRHGIDFCCGGKAPLRSACRAHGVSVAEILSAIEASAAERHDERDWTREPLDALIDHIVSTYHDALREELPRLEAMAAKVADVHGARAPVLRRLAAAVTALSAELRAHMDAEERVLFPAVRAAGRGSHRPGSPLSVPISALEDEHDRAGRLLLELRTSTDGYVPPAWACATFRALYQGLSELESSMHVHVHLENNVLFPRAMRLAGEA
ncbi:MAG: iron-sulfur cluster repair di-iron protein [Vicinamibacterales bacterium]